MKTVAKPVAKTLEHNAVDYFKAKLQFENTPHTLKVQLEKGEVVLLDVRDNDSFVKEHIPGAVNIPMTELVSRLKELPKNKTIVTYCWNITCAMAPKAALQLAEKGFRVQELVGGIAEWKAKFPVEGKK